MLPYICVSHALARREATDAFCRGLSRYGFRFACIHEQSEPQTRRETLTEASLLIALTCPAAVAAETVTSDIRFAMERGTPVLCVSMEENELDARFCTSEKSAVLIPTPVVDSTDHTAVDRQSAALFVHRLFVRHLARLDICFSPLRCVEDAHGKTIAAAVAAHKGDAEACYALGLAYERGEGVPKLEVEAARWIAEAARHGVADARIRMGELYLSGRGTDRDPDAAFRLFTEASAARDLRGDFYRGLCFLRGLGVMKDPERARECFQIAALGGYAPAMYEMGLLHRGGIGGPRDHKAAVSAMFDACQHREGGEESIFPLSLMGPYWNKSISRVTMRQLRRTHLKDVVSEQLKKKGKSLSESRFDVMAAKCFTRNRMTAIDLPEDGWLSEVVGNGRTELSDYTSTYSPANAAIALGQMLAEGDVAGGILPHPTRALVWYRYGLRLGGTDALYLLGDAYRRGYGIPASSERAFRLFELAAARGDDRSCFALGVCYEQGIGTAPDPVKAFRCYEKTAENGYAPGQNNLGGCYEKGMGVAKDDHAAAEWYARAAVQEVSAACRLGICYEQGRGVEQNLMEAFRLYTYAAEGGNAYAKYRLGLMYDAGVRELAPKTSPAASAEIPGTIHENELPVADIAIPADYALATRLFREAAEMGVGDAAYALSLCYGFGRGVRRDGVQALDYMRQAADAGNVSASCALGLLYLEGDFVVKDAVRGVSYFARAASLWDSSTHESDSGSLPGGILTKEGLSSAEAGSTALYMLGYCVLYAVGDSGNPALAVPAGRLTQSQRLELAVGYFEKAAQEGHVGALVALGDLYAYGLRKANGDSEERFLTYYREAIQAGTARSKTTKLTLDAYMSLAKHSMSMAEAATVANQPASAERAKLQTWRFLQSSSELGSQDALVNMAACAYYGYGTSRNTGAALWFLERAANNDGGRITALLWLGDVYRMGLQGQVSYDRADRMYLRAVQMEDRESESGAYTLRPRRKERRRVDHTARAEACYRLATLRAVHFADGQDIRESFPYLVRAVLMGHSGAEEDLARMYAYESTYIRATSIKNPPKRSGRTTPTGLYARHRLAKSESASATRRDGRAARSHEGWINDYYTALWPEPTLFSMEMKPVTVLTERPAYVSAEVTPAMRAAALNYLGDCLFFGEGISADPAAAVACYRKVADMKLQLPRGTAAPIGQVWAQYSYGWCLLHGVGTPEAPREAVRYLTMAAKIHAEACYALGECYENGIGVDVADGVEAFKFYRKALKLGYRKAESKVRALEKKLRTEA